jgi:hypothetical protein
MRGDEIPDDLLNRVLGPPSEQAVRSERLHQMRRALLRTVRYDEITPDPLQEEMFRLAIYDQARHRRLLMTLAKRCWGHAETGPISRLGDIFDEFEYHSRRRRARRNMGRKVVRGGA